MLDLCTFIFALISCFFPSLFLTLASLELFQNVRSSVAVFPKLISEGGKWCNRNNCPEMSFLFFFLFLCLEAARCYHMSSFVETKALEHLTKSPVEFVEYPWQPITIVAEPHGNRFFSLFSLFLFEYIFIFFFKCQNSVWVTKELLHWFLVSFVIYVGLSTVGATSKVHESLYTFKITFIFLRKKIKITERTFSLCIAWMQLFMLVPKYNSLVP